MKKIVSVKHDDIEIECGVDSEYRTIVQPLKVGDRIILCESRYVGPSNCHHDNGDSHYYFEDYESNPDGIGGNCNQDIKELNGWRGTTDDWAVFVRGVWVIKSIGKSRFWEDEILGIRKVRVELESVDLDK